METLTLKGSVLLCFKQTHEMEGSWWLSTEMSGVSDPCGSNAVDDAVVNSPERMNPKNPRQQAAQSRAMSVWFVCLPSPCRP